MPNEVVNAVVQRLFPLSSIVIMQQNSAAYMLHEKETHSNEALELLARKILQLGSAAVVLQGGIVTKASFTDVLVEKNKTAHFYTPTWLYRPHYSRFGRSIYIGSCC